MLLLYTNGVTEAIDGDKLIIRAILRCLRSLSGDARKICHIDESQRKGEQSMNISRKTFLTLCVLLVVATGAPLQAATPEESLRKNFPDIPMESITKTDIPGIYEVVAGGRVAYYAPAQEYLIIGEIVSKEKKNLTQERNGEIMGQRMKSLPLEKALKIGNGPRKVIELTDPDCPFCRTASKYFAERKDVTRYVFLYPLTIHPNAEAKIKYIFCAKDKVKAYEEAMAGKLDDMKFKPCDDAAAADLVNAHKEICNKVGIAGLGTPMFVIDGKVVRGANIPEMEKILGPKK
jgi:thiol:disulfide interchange protein DsbC